MVWEDNFEEKFGKGLKVCEEDGCSSLSSPMAGFGNSGVQISIYTNRDFVFNYLLL